MHLKNLICPRCRDESLHQRNDGLISCVTIDCPYVDTRWQLDKNQPAPQQQLIIISTRCPSCGNPTLQLDKSGNLFCTYIGCQDPTLISNLHKLTAKQQAPTTRSHTLRTKLAYDCPVCRQRTQHEQINGQPPLPTDLCYQQCSTKQPTATPHSQRTW